MIVEEKKWVLRLQDGEEASRLAHSLESTPLVGQILLNRGLADEEEAHQFLNSHLGDLTDPYLMRDMEPAVERIIRALRDKEKILIYGDYDVDGVTATSLLLLFLRDLGFSVYYYIPNRVNEGYGMNDESIRRFHERGIRLIITVEGDTDIEVAVPMKTIGKVIHKL